MNHEEFFDEPARVTVEINGEGHLNPHRVVWQGHNYKVIAVGRQWDEADGRHVLVEAVGGMRFELQLRREDFAWRVRRVWRAVEAA
jgi:hypothetical protein